MKVLYPVVNRSVTPRHIITLAMGLLVALACLMCLDGPAGAGCFDPGSVCQWKQKPTGTTPGIIDTGCSKVPTSLFIVNTDSAAYDDGYSGGTSMCGFNYSTNKACGSYPLSSQVCGPGIGYGPFCDPCDILCAEYDSTLCSWDGRRAMRARMIDPKELEGVHRRLQELRSLDPTGRLAAFLAHLGDSPAVHVRAKLTIVPAAPGGRAIEGAYEYWEQGESYRIHVELPAGARVPEISVSDVAFDGWLYQLAFSTDDLLSIARGDTRAVPLGIDNPLWLAAGLHFSGVSCPGCALRLSDLAAFKTTPAPKLEAQPGATGLRFEVDKNNHLQSAHLSEGGTSQHVIMAAYRGLDGVQMEFPWHIEVARTNADGSKFTYVYDLETLDFKAAVPRQAFSLNRDAFSKVFDSDRGVWIKGVRCDQQGGAPAP